MKAEGFPVRAACEAAEVSTSAYYDWTATVAAGPTEAEWDEALIVNEMHDVHAHHDDTYGSPRVTLSTPSPLSSTAVHERLSAGTLPQKPSRLFYNRMEEPVLRRPVEPKQYLSQDFRGHCTKLGIVESVGRVGSCHDNSPADSFWASLKRELVSRFRFEARAQARHAITAWIKHYIATRLHSSLGNLPPIEWELRYRLESRQAA